MPKVPTKNTTEMTSNMAGWTEDVCQTLPNLPLAPGSWWRNPKQPAIHDQKARR
jgi:hypothetical protein